MKEALEIDGTGWLVRTLEAALWAFECTRSFEEAALVAVNLGNDADTTGALYGASRIPERWLAGSTAQRW